MKVYWGWVDLGSKPSWVFRVLWPWQQQAEEVIEEVIAEAEPEPRENLDVTEVKTAETADTEKALCKGSRVGKTADRVEETEVENDKQVSRRGNCGWSSWGNYWC